MGSCTRGSTLTRARCRPEPISDVLCLSPQTVFPPHTTATDKTRASPLPPRNKCPITTVSAAVSIDIGRPTTKDVSIRYKSTLIAFPLSPVQPSDQAQSLSRHRLPWVPGAARQTDDPQNVVLFIFFFPLVFPLLRQLTVFVASSTQKGLAAILKNAVSGSGTKKITKLRREVRMSCK